MAYLGAFGNSLVDDKTALLQVLLHGVYRANLTDSLLMLVKNLWNLCGVGHLYCTSNDLRCEP